MSKFIFFTVFQLLLLLSYGCETDAVKNKVDEINHDFESPENPYEPSDIGHFVNHEVNAPTSSCSGSVEITEDQSKVEDQNVYPEDDKKYNDYKEGCEVLGEVLKTADKQKLATCFESIKKIITEGAMSSGKINRKKLFCNMFNKLNQKEQEFAGLMFTTLGEAGVFSSLSKVQNPKYQEQLYVMKVITNRVNQARRDFPGRVINSLDVSLSPYQFSMYNDGKLFENSTHIYKPVTMRSAKQINHGIAAFITIKSDPKSIKPQPQVERMDKYVNPNLVKCNSGVQKKYQPWFCKAKKITPTFNGISPMVSKSKNGHMHQFFLASSSKSYYGSKKKISWRRARKCGK